MTPAQLAAAVTKTNNLILAACPVFDHVTGAKIDKTGALAKIAHDIQKAIGEYGATPDAVAASVINTIQNCGTVDTSGGPSYDAGYAGQGIGGEGYTNLPSQFAPKGTTKPGLTDAQKKVNALQSANVQKAHDLLDAMKADGSAAGKNFLGLDGVVYDQWTGGYEAAAAALFAAAPVVTTGSAAQNRTNALQAANVQQARDGKPFLGLDGGRYDQYDPNYKAAAAALIAAAGGAPAPPPPSGAWNGPERRTGPQHVRASDSGAVSTGGQAHVG